MLISSGGDIGDGGCDVFDDGLDDINDDDINDIQVLQEGLSQHLRGSQRKGNRGGRSETSLTPSPSPSPSPLERVVMRQLFPKP